mmetsp:Transcript_31568/g.122251  ORF Transcript_31568/g.122251 Transcript_31568/m.122251 type:complete len:390 (-) Transcript_31568:2317-3486(-)|eukprot:CAMPEP_0113969126 /NCGR_PEP_ID=MMETSP0011_2-20120614/10045_1 /TAXON_ID=101924 /ORGANISM="Rhodosorus marinus" /LENGTH=389 /DNA_ID=CAMNT_0000982551 /DNA_START=129 /DNA_END=1298 /DNA_ORIENTATION=+ /assembly_acc=CAM_ASM_000156
MGKDGFLTPKAISNKIKAKGLQKLKFYCQMCDKQCRDANGFKCHKESEGHQRMMLLFAESSDKYIRGFSDQFLEGYLDILRHRFGTKQVKANAVYQEYIKDRHHVHMNSTKWATLSEFVAWLGREGLCAVEEKEEGWYIAYIDRKVTERSRKAAEMEEKRLREAELADRKIERKMKKARLETPAEEERNTELVRDKTLTVGLEIKSKRLPAALPSDGSMKGDVFRNGLPNGDKFDASRKKNDSVKEKTSALDEIRQEQEKRNIAKQSKRYDNWLFEGISVKIVDKQLADGKFYKKKGEVVEVVDEFVAVVRPFDYEKVKLQIDQEGLETVIPKPGGEVLILNGYQRGNRGTLDEIDEKNFCVSIRMQEGPIKGRVVEKVSYEDVSRWLG